MFDDGLDRNQTEYFRIPLLKLEEEFENEVLTFKARYKQSENSRWATFNCVSLYTSEFKTKQICEHINIERAKISRYICLKNNTFYYIIGYASSYDHYGDRRGKVCLLETDDIIPIFESDPTTAPQKIISRFYSEKKLHRIRDFLGAEYVKNFDNIRVYQLAKILGTSSKVLMKLLRENNIVMKNHMEVLKKEHLIVLLDFLKERYDIYGYNLFYKQSERL